MKNLKLLRNYATTQLRNFLNLTAIIMVFSLLFISCTKEEKSKVANNTIVSTETRNETADLSTIFDVGSCMNIFDLVKEKNDECFDVKIKNDTFIGFEPFPECEIVGTYWYTVCVDKFNGNFKYAYVNEPKFTSHCPEFDDYLARYPDRRHELFNLINVQALSEIEDIIWKEEDFATNKCDDHESGVISWVKGTCSSWQLFVDIFNNYSFQKVSCEGSGCCFRNTYLCYDSSKGEVVKVTSSVEMDEPIADCPSSEAVPGDGNPFELGPCTPDCEL